MRIILSPWNSGGGGVGGVGGGQGKLSRTACHPPPPTTPCQYVTQLNIWSKHPRLTEIKFISLPTKNSCSRWCNKICVLSVFSEILCREVVGGVVQDKPPWTACPPHPPTPPLAPDPLLIRNPTEHLKEASQIDWNIPFNYIFLQ